MPLWDSGWNKTLPRELFKTNHIWILHTDTNCTRGRHWIQFYLFLFVLVLREISSSNVRYNTHLHIIHTYIMISNRSLTNQLIVWWLRNKLHVTYCTWKVCVSLIHIQNTSFICSILIYESNKLNMLKRLCVSSQHCHLHLIQYVMFTFSRIH